MGFMAGVSISALAFMNIGLALYLKFNGVDVPHELDITATIWAAALLVHMGRS